MPAHSVSKHATGVPLTVPGLRPADALALMQAVQGSGVGLQTTRVLDGQHVAVLAPTENHPSAEVFSCAAQALGARIARIAPADLGLGDAASAPDTARLLGRLYAAIGCAGLDLKSVTLLKRTCGIPVLHDLAADTHGTRLLADAMTLSQALHEADPAAPSRPRLGVYGPPRSALLRAWKQMAAGVGVDVIGLFEAGSDAHTAGCHFVCRPGAPCELLAIASIGSHAASHETSLAHRQRSNHCLVVQVLLRHELGARR